VEARTYQKHIRNMVAHAWNPRGKKSHAVGQP
jgi:hypothetical protein